jgi:hypothetical protein
MYIKMIKFYTSNESGKAVWIQALGALDFCFQHCAFKTISPSVWTWGLILTINPPCLPLLPGVFSNIDNHGILNLKDNRDHLVPSTHYIYEEPEVQSGDVSYPRSHGELLPLTSLYEVKPLLLPVLILKTQRPISPQRSMLYVGFQVKISIQFPWVREIFSQEEASLG